MVPSSRRDMDARFLDDFTPGQRFCTGGITLTEAEIIDFAWRYDPQPFHLDTGAAERSPYGGLIASGFQSLALCFRLFIQSGMLAESSMGSPGIDELRWLAPVRPGDTLHCAVEVLEVRPSSSITCCCAAPAPSENPGLRFPAAPAKRTDRPAAGQPDGQRHRRIAVAHRRRAAVRRAVRAAVSRPAPA